MSQENVELSGRVIDAFNRHDPEAMVAPWDPSCEWRDSKCVRMVGYRDHADAVEAAGLS